MQRKRGRDGSMWHPTVTGCLHLCRNVLRGMPKIRNARRPISQGRGTYQSASVTGSLLGRNCDDGSIEAGKCCRGWQLGGRQGNALSHMDGRQGSSNHSQEANCDNNANEPGSDNSPPCSQPWFPQVIANRKSVGWGKGGEDGVDR